MSWSHLHQPVSRDFSLCGAYYSGVLGAISSESYRQPAGRVERCALHMGPSRALALIQLQEIGRARREYAWSAGQQTCPKHRADLELHGLVLLHGEPLCDGSTTSG